jgi:hypothetical protein
MTGPHHLFGPTDLADGLLGAYRCLAEGERKDLQPLADPHVELIAVCGRVGHDLVQRGGSADRGRGGLLIPGHRDGAGARGDDVDVFRRVVQPNGGVVAVGGGPLVVQGPAAAQGEIVVGQLRG